MTTSCDTNTVTIFWTFSGIIVGCAFTYYFSTRLFNKQREANAISLFREDFVEEIILCEKDILPDQDDILSIVEKNIISQEKAIIRFRPFISRSCVGNFKKASYEYTDYYKRVKAYAVPEPGIATNDAHIESLEKERRKTVLSKIEKLLKYA